MRRSELSRIPFHVFLISVFPAFALLVNNLGESDLSIIQRPLVLSIPIGLLFLFAGRVLAKDWQKAGMWATFSVVMFFSYGHIYQIVEDISLFGIVVGRHRYLVILWGAAFLLGSWLLRKFQGARESTPIINLVSLFLVLFQVIQIAAYQINKYVSRNRAQTTVSENLITSINPPDKLPDIYLIILDMYGREDALASHYGYDNHGFISQLRDVGFYVADCARSNYGTTALSLSSQLNLDYIDALLDVANVESTSYLIKNSAVRLALENVGYTSIAFNTGFVWANVENSNIYINKPPDPLLWNVDPFEKIFLEGTLVRPFFDFYISQGIGELQYFETPNEMKAQRTQFVLDYLRLLPQMGGPKFVDAHILMPHPPHVFNADGTINIQATANSDDKNEFRIQLDYLNPRIIEIVKRIINRSEPDPIILLEGDHGLFDFERTSNLIALYLPEVSEEVLYPHITLVNTFRIIFNQVLGTDFDLLEDRSYTREGDDNYAYDPNPLKEWNPDCQSGEN